MKQYIIFSEINWDSLWQHPQTIAEILAKKNAVYFVNPSFSKKSSTNQLKIGSGNSRIRKVKLIYNKKSFRHIGLRYWLGQELYHFKILRENHKESEAIFLYSPFMEILAIIYAKIKKKKIIFFYVDDYPELTQNKLLKIYLKITIPLLIRSAHKTICTSEILFKRALKINGNCYYIPNGVDLSKLTKSRNDGKTKKFTLGFVGTLEPWVQASDLIYLAKNMPDIKIIIIGSGSELEKIKTKQDKFKLNNIELLGFIPHSKIFQYIDTFDLAIIPFKLTDLSHSVSPIKLFEYWARKKCVIATKMSELTKYENEIFFYKSKGKLLELVRYLQSNPLIITQKGKDGYKKVVVEHDWSGNLQKKLLDAINND
ncbi:MAG: Glycosyl transferase group 1 [candidate division CPR2 bacterium GW2011_GWC1_39_9]|uniref:Glycosyl transferase group 1 n=1 Tax=candidate division CPR2 bacterium GW2011_GWC2_39_10 TaxID=1618345 RepID=A0A0G0LUK9_UNCC2|nr:MAG: Glycosyl transferase group 1 [candidate division CPR2 bacterium GW2011_GWC2_39_10]KKR35420.1 MAG: Glycosyl transferase group 1 [candidate division CPR2 bacterium GW2011_GWC1_39_9]